jgi:effector-binding domain-containing protein
VAEIGAPPEDPVSYAARTRASPVPVLPSRGAAHGSLESPPGTDPSLAGEGGEPLKTLVPIGRFSAICRLSQKALRLYDEMGLLRPAWVDPESGYRYYAVAQAVEAERIRLLRSLEVPLEDVSEFLHDPAGRTRVVDRHRRRLESRVGQLQTLLASLDQLEREDAMTYEVRTKELAPQPIVAIRLRTRLAEVGSEAGRAFGELFAHLGRAGAAPAGPPMALYHGAPGEDEHVDVEFCVPVSRPMSGVGRISGRELPGGAAAYTLHCGPYDAVGPAYGALQRWIQEHGHEGSGAPREIYLVGPQQVADPAQLRTEVQWPIR